MDPKSVEFDWECPVCGETASCSYYGLAESGNPVCPNCDCDMELKDDLADNQPNRS